MSFTDLKNIHEHPVYLFGDKVAEICKPLFDRFPISYFSYNVIKGRNSVSALASNREWTCHYIQSDYKLLFIGEKAYSWVSSGMSVKALAEASSAGF